MFDGIMSSLYFEGWAGDFTSAWPPISVSKLPMCFIQYQRRLSSVWGNPLPFDRLLHISTLNHQSKIQEQFWEVRSVNSLWAKVACDSLADRTLGQTKVTLLFKDNADPDPSL